MPTAANPSWSLNWAEFVAYFNANISVLGTPVAIGVAILLAVMVAHYVPIWMKRAKTTSVQVRAGLARSNAAGDKPTTDHTQRAAPRDPDEIALETVPTIAQRPAEQPTTEIPDDLSAAGFYEIANQAMAEGRATFADVSRVTDVGHTTWAEKARELLRDAQPLPTNQEANQAAQSDQAMAQPMPARDDPGEAQRKAAVTRRINRWRQLVEFLNLLARRATLIFSQLINRGRRERLPSSIPVQPVIEQDIRGAFVVVRDTVQEQNIDPETARRGRIVRVLGTDPRNKYDLRYEVVELSTLIASHTATGEINPAYPAELQPRDRSRVASRTQIQHIAAKLEPDALLSETHSLDRGAMIVGSDDVVESGNARTLALRISADEYPNQYEQYRARLSEIASDLGIDAAEVELMDRPVLVRRRMTDVDRVEFSREANQSAILEMGAAEHARSDADYISTEMLLGFEMGETQSAEEAIRSARNRGFVQSFVGRMNENARGRMMDETGQLSQEGVRRIAGAMLERVFPDRGMAARLFEDIDNDIRNVTGGLMRSLGPLARAEEMARTGQRGGDLLLASDIAVAVEKMSSLKSTGLDVPIYLAQGQMFERELTTTQEDILSGLYERRRSAKAISEWVRDWADLVERSPDPRQGSLFGQSQPPRRDELLGRWGQAPTALQSGFAF